MPSANASFDIGRLNAKEWRSLCISNNMTAAGYKMTFPSSNQTIVGRTTTDTMTNKTLTSPTINAATITGTVTVANGATLTTPVLTSPTLTGTMVNPNVAMGSSNITASNGAVIVTHGMSGTPTRIQLTYAGNPGNNTSTLYWGTANATNFTISVTANVTSNVAVGWVAWILGE